MSVAPVTVKVDYGKLPEAFRKDPDGVSDLLVREVVHDVTEYVANRLRVMTPSGATGLAAQSVVTDIDRSLRGNYEGHINYAEPASSYIGFADQGTRPHWAPYDAIELWVRRVIGDPSLTGAVRAGIAKRGTKAQHFVEQTANSVAGEVPQVAALAVYRVAKVI